MATDDEDQQQLKLALELSLQDVQKDIDEQEREKQDTIAALAASLGKSVDQLTAREVLSVTMGADIQRAPKRPAEDTNSSAAPSKKPNTTGDRFWEGAVKLTYIAGFTDPRAIRIEDIIQKVVLFSKSFVGRRRRRRRKRWVNLSEYIVPQNTLKKAVLTAMVASEEFLETHIPRETNVCLVMHGPRASWNWLTILMPRLANWAYTRLRRDKLETEYWSLPLCLIPSLVFSTPNWCFLYMILTCVLLLALQIWYIQQRLHPPFRITYALVIADILWLPRHWECRFHTRFSKTPETCRYLANVRKRLGRCFG